MAIIIAILWSKCDDKYTGLLLIILLKFSLELIKILSSLSIKSKPKFDNSWTVALSLSLSFILNLAIFTISISFFEIEAFKDRIGIISGVSEPSNISFSFLFQLSIWEIKSIIFLSPCNELTFNPFILIFEPIEFATKKKATCE